MMPMGIPDWNAQGVLPLADANWPASSYWSPYTVRLGEVVQRFGITPERLTILGGLLRYRAALHSVGLTGGFQWLDGSFLENVELLEGRGPNDIDVTTFYQLPGGETQASLAPRVSGILSVTTASHLAIKEEFHVDAYTQCLDVSPARLIRQSTYWHTVWSHRRNVLWKGYLQVDLAPAEDVEATMILAALVSSELKP